jgi:hypothetical protein
MDAVAQHCALMCELCAKHGVLQLIVLWLCRLTTKVINDAEADVKTTVTAYGCNLVRLTGDSVVTCSVSLHAVVIGDRRCVGYEHG